MSPRGRQSSHRSTSVISRPASSTRRPVVSRKVDTVKAAEQVTGNFASHRPDFVVKCDRERNNVLVNEPSEWSIDCRTPLPALCLAIGDCSKSLELRDRELARVGANYSATLAYHSIGLN